MFFEALIKEYARYILFIGSFFIVITVIGFGIIIRKIDNIIDKKQQKIDDLVSKDTRDTFNVKTISSQMLKLVASRNTYMVLQELNSKKLGLVEKQMDRQMKMAITATRKRGFSKEEESHFDSLPSLEKEKLFLEAIKQSNKSWNERLAEKNKLRKNIVMLKNLKERCNIIFVILEVVGLFAISMANFYTG